MQGQKMWGGAEKQPEAKQLSLARARRGAGPSADTLVSHSQDGADGLKQCGEKSTSILANKCWTY